MGIRSELNAERRYRARTTSRRFGAALAGAVALHVAVFAVLPWRTPAPADERVRAELVTLVQRTPPPTPRPTPPPVVPTPHITPPPRYTLAPRIVVRAPAPKAVAKPRHAAGGAAAPIHLALVTPVPVPRTPAVPHSIVQGTHMGVAPGGAGTGAGPGSGDGGQGGTGTGTGGTGNGNGGEANTAPCGDIYILPAELTYRKDGTAVQHVLAKIVLLDGTVEVDRFPYPFTYPSEGKNPFLNSNMLSKSGGVPVQEPPPGTDLASLPPAVQVVVKYTNPATGETTMPECTHDAPAA